MKLMNLPLIIVEIVTDNEELHDLGYEELHDLGFFGYFDSP